MPIQIYRLSVSVECKIEVELHRFKQFNQFLNSFQLRVATLDLEDTVIYLTAELGKKETECRGLSKVLEEMILRYMNYHLHVFF